MTLNTTKSSGDNIIPSEWNEAATACNKVTDQTLVSADISDFDTSVSSNITVTSKLGNVVDDTTPQLGGNLDAQSNDVSNLKSTNFAINAIGNSGASTTITLENGGFQTITLDQNTTLTISATTLTRTSLVISGGASYTVTWNGVTWLTPSGAAPTLDGTDVITFIYDGTTIYGAISNQQ